MENWPYALNSKLAKQCGGPQKLLDLTYAAGVREGMQKMAPVVAKKAAISSVISSVVTLCTIGTIGTIYYFAKKKRRSKQDLARKNDHQTIAHTDVGERYAK